MRAITIYPFQSTHIYISTSLHNHTIYLSIYLSLKDWRRSSAWVVFKPPMPMVPLPSTCNPAPSLSPSLRLVRRDR